MKLEITRIDASLPLPSYATSGSVAFDVYARETTVVKPRALGFVPTNLVCRVPAGYALLLASRSSTPSKKGCSTPHGIGVVDQDFCGPKDEMRVQLYNFTDAPVTIERGERVAQALLVPVEKCELVEVTLAGNANSRGGFGSTG